MATLRYPGLRGPLPKLRIRSRTLNLSPLLGAQPQGLLTAQGTFSSSGSNGLQSITGFGFQPRVIYFAYNYQLITGYNASGGDSGFGFGVACLDGSQWLASSQVKDNTASATSVVHCDPTGCIGLTNDAVTVVTFARLVSMDVDGFTLNWTTTTVNPTITYLALGGTDLLAAHAGYFMSLGAVGSQSVKGIGFRPNLLLLDQPSLSLTTTPPYHSAASAHTAFGAGSGTNPLNRWALDTRHSDPTTGDGGIHSTVNIVAGLNSSTGAGDVADLTSLDADGFTLKWSANLAATSKAVFYLATQTVKTPTVGSLSIPNSSAQIATFATYATDDYGLNAYGTGGGSTPIALLVFSDDNNLGDLTGLANGRFSFGMTSSGASTSGGTASSPQYNYWWGSRDAQTTTIERTEFSQIRLAAIEAEATGGTATSLTTIKNASPTDTIYYEQKGFTVTPNTSPLNTFTLFYIAFASSILDRAPGDASGESNVATDSLFKGAGKPLADTLTAATDAILKAVGKPITDTLTAATDTVVRAYIGFRTATDTLTAATDSVQKAVGKPIVDTLSAATDAIKKAVGKPIADTLTGATDVVQKAVGKPIADTLTAATDAVSRFFIGARSVSDTLTAAVDSVLKNVGKPIGDTLSAATDAVTRLLVLTRSPSDALSAATDAVIKAVGKPIADTLSAATDSVIKAVGKPIADTLSAATDVVQKALGKSIADTLTAATDAVSRLFIGARSASDTLTAATDAVVKGVGKPVADTLTAATDAVARLLVLGRSLADTLTAATDVVIKGVGKPILDTLTAAVDAVSLSAFARSVADTLTAATDAVARLEVLGRTASDTLTAATDAVSRLYIGARSLSDTLTAAVDSLVKDVGKPVADALSAATDVVARLYIGSRSPTDTLSAATDSLTRLFIGTRAIADTLTAATDVVIKAVAKPIADALSAAIDSMSRLYIGGRAISDGLVTATDSTVKAIGKFATETLTTSDTLIKGIGKLVTDTLSAAFDSLTQGDHIVRISDTLTAATDSVLKGVGKPLAEALTISDSVRKAVSKFTADTLTAATDSLVRFISPLRALTESLPVASDVVSRLGVLRRTLTESNVLTDAVRKAVVKSVADTLTAATDAVQKAVGKFLSEVSVASDLVVQSKNGAINNFKTVAEALTAAVDSAPIRLQVLRRTATDTLPAISDSIARGLVHSFAATVSFTGRVGKLQLKTLAAATLSFTGSVVGHGLIAGGLAIESFTKAVIAASRTAAIEVGHRANPLLDGVRATAIITYNRVISIRIFPFHK